MRKNLPRNLPRNRALTSTSPSHRRRIDQLPALPRRVEAVPDRSRDRPRGCAALRRLSLRARGALQPRNTAAEQRRRSQMGCNGLASHPSRRRDSDCAQLDASRHRSPARRTPSPCPTPCSSVTRDACLRALTHLRDFGQARTTWHPPRSLPRAPACSFPRPQSEPPWAPPESPGARLLSGPRVTGRESPRSAERAGEGAGAQ